MLKMGRMCHCDGIWDVKSWDASGGLRFKIDTFNGTSPSLPNRCDSIYLDSDGNLYTFQGDSVPSQDDGRLQKWTGASSGAPTRAWFSDRNGKTSPAAVQFIIYPDVRYLGVDGNGVIYARCNTLKNNIVAWNSSGVQQASPASLTGGAVVGLAGGDAQFGNGGANAGSDHANVVTQQNSSLTETDDDTYGGTADRMTVDARACIPIPGGGWFIVGAATTNTPLAMTLDSGLDRTGTFSKSGKSGARGMVSWDGAYGYATSTANDVYQIALSGMTEVWAGTPGGALEMLSCDDDGNLYGAYGASGQNVVQLDAADGALNWTISPAASFGAGERVDRIAGHPDGVIVAGRWTSNSVQGVYVQLRAKSDGSLVWERDYCKVTGLMSDLLVDQATGDVYLAGGRIKRTGGSDTGF